MCVYASIDDASLFKLDELAEPCGLNLVLLVYLLIDYWLYWFMVARQVTLRPHGSWFQLQDLLFEQSFSCFSNVRVLFGISW